MTLITASILLVLLNLVFSLKLAVVVPFSPRDYQKLGATFERWETYPPCDITGPHLNSYHLYLSYSRDLDNDHGKDVVLPYLRQQISKPHGWMNCFYNIKFFSCGIESTLDIYDPSKFNTDLNWVNGPNQQFLKMAKFFESLRGESAFDAWYLMEMDSVPYKPYFLDALATEINEERPFAILGSVYRGDKWDMMLNNVHPFLRSHINGNAVYNSSHKVYDILVNSLLNESQTYFKSIPYDYRMSQIIQENIYLDHPIARDGLFRDKKKFYNGGSRVIGNYASTNMIPKLFNDEHIIHGARLFQEWNATETPIGLVVTDWGMGGLDIFLDSLEHGYHPFSDVVIVVPIHVIPENRLTIMRGRDREIQIRYVTRNNPEEQNNEDFLDYCYHQPETTQYFMVTNTYMKIASPVNLLVTADTKKPLISYIPAQSELCFGNQDCTDILESAHSVLNYSLKYVVNDMQMIFEKEYVGSLRDKYNRDGYCRRWFDSYYKNNTDDCVPRVGASSSGYLAYLEQRNQLGIYHLSNSVSFGTRDAFIPHVSILPSDESRYCGYKGFSKKREAKLASHLFIGPRKKLVYSPALVHCVNIVDDPEKCERQAFCGWKPRFNKCIQIYETSDSYEEQFLRNRRGETTEVRYPSSPITCPTCPAPSSNTAYKTATIVLGVLLGAMTLLALLLLIPLLIWLIKKFCVGYTLEGPARVVETFQNHVEPAMQEDVIVDHGIMDGITMDAIPARLPPIPPPAPPGFGVADTMLFN